jgi:hypothetical protein
MNKKSYFQGGGGVNLPTPKKRKYKADPAILNMPRFKEPLYKNYDYVEAEGVDGKAKHGPGTGAYSGKHKSIKDFRKSKKKLKYKADEYWQQDDGTITKKRKRKIKSRAHLIQLMIKYAIDLPYDESPTGSIIGDSYNRNYIGTSNDYLGPVDGDGRKEDALNYGQQKDIPESEAAPARERAPKKSVEELLKSFLNLISREGDLFGMSGGVESSALDADEMEQNNQYFGNTDPPNNQIKIPWL